MRKSTTEMEVDGFANRNSDQEKEYGIPVSNQHRSKPVELFLLPPKYKQGKPEILYLEDLTFSRSSKGM
jgi:hypothetical protein